MKPRRLLDLFCGAGGAAVGYHRAGFTEIVGVDIAPMPRYPFPFVQADALKFLRTVKPGDFDLIHASPPCQRYSATANIPNRDASRYGDHFEEVRERLTAVGTPWVIENVVGAPFQSGVELCGAMFGLRVFRHRRFESNHLLLTHPHRRHTERIGAKGLASYVNTPGAMVTVAGHLFSQAAGNVAMGIDWMTKDELAEAIPPAYCEYLGRQLAAQIGAAP